MRRIAFALAFFLSTAPLLSAQAIRATPTQISLGGGALIGENGVIANVESAFAVIQWHGVQMFSDAVMTGVGIEIYPARVMSLKEGDVLAQQFDQVPFRVYGLFRTKLSVLGLPGEVWDSMFLGTDVPVATGGEDEDIRPRLVYGVQEKAGPGWLDLEIYMFEKYRPVGFALMYRYDF